MKAQYEEFVKILNDTVSECTSKDIALSGGLDSSVIAYSIKSKKPDAHVLISKDFVAQDLTYCQMIAANLNLHLNMIMVDTEKIIDAIDDTIKILGNFNDIEIRNSIVMYLTLKMSGARSIITGDGADELFAGYNFLLKKSDTEIQKDLDRISEIMHFPSKKIGEALGITVETPFLSQNMIEFAKKIPLSDKIGIYNGAKFGKWIIRKSFEGKIPEQIVWRKKAAMQDGSGTVGLTNLFGALITDESFKKDKIKIWQDGKINIRSKESMYYYQRFIKHHHMPQNRTQNICPDCRCDIRKNSRFCKMCGRFPV